MTDFRGRSREAPSARLKDSEKIDANQREFVRKVAYALLEIIDGKGHFEGDNEARGKSLQTRPSQAKGNDKREVQEESRVIVRFEKLREKHGRLTYQIQGLLKALGGGGRTAKALKQMNNEVTKMAALFSFNNKKREELKLEDCSKTLDACREAAVEVLKAFKEFEVYNQDFFDSIENIKKQLEDVPLKLDVEYGMYNKLRVDKYLDSVFEPLIVGFETFLSGLTDIAEKEIAAIRLAQDFASQRYLNLTTVATFLSSVTATTLQITASDSDSPLTTITSITNTLWFISLVFSTASAVYSLLVMTWRQSSVRQPKQTLPEILNIWFKNGPMYTLIAAVMTFSIGLCLLAYRVAEEQGGIVSAVIPTAFAGAHAYSVFIFSAWFLLEKWKAVHRESWNSVRDKYLVPLANVAGKLVNVLKRSVIRAKDYAKRKSQDYLKSVKTSFRNLKARITSWRRNSMPAGTSDDDKVNIDIESGQDAPSPIATPSADPGEISLASQIPHDEQEMSPQALASPQQASEPADDSHQSPATAELENALAIPGTQATPGNAENEETNQQVKEEGMEYKPFENILQFSPDGRFLAAAYSGTVTIYDVDNQFSVFRTVKATDGDQIKQIEWNPYAASRELLVRSSGELSAWNVDSSLPAASKVGYLNERIGSAHWAHLDDEHGIALIYTIGTIIEVRDSKFKEIPSIKPIDVAERQSINRIIDASFFGPKYILCLAESDTTWFGRFLIINAKGLSVESDLLVRPGHISMLASREAGKILLQGNRRGVEVVNLRFSDSPGDFDMSVIDSDGLWWNTRSDHELTTPESAVLFHGKKHRMIVGYSAGEIAVLYRRGLGDRYSSLHIFTTPSMGAAPQNPIGFTVNRATKSEPYMFAFTNEHGVVTIWSIQSNTALSKCKHAEPFNVHDKRGGHSAELIDANGKFLILKRSRGS